MKNFLFKMWYLLTCAFIKGNWAKLFMSLEEIERKKNEALPRVIFRIERLRNAKPRHVRSDLKKLLGRKCKYVSDTINGVRINDFLSGYGRDISYIESRLSNDRWSQTVVYLVGGRSEEILELFENKEFLVMNSINVRPYGDTLHPIVRYNEVVHCKYEEMMRSCETKPKECDACSGDCDGDHYIDHSWECAYCNHKMEGQPERLPKDDTSGMLEALETNRIKTGNVFLKIDPNA